MAGSWNRDGRGQGKALLGEAALREQETAQQPALLLLHCSSPVTGSLPLTEPLHHRPCGCAGGSTHTLLDTQTCPETSSASPPPAPSLTWPQHHPEEGETIPFIGVSCPSGRAFWTNSLAVQCPAKPCLCCWVWEFALQFELKRKEGNLRVFCYKHRCRW